MRFNNQKPLVSICVTCFNSGEYIHRIIDSSLNQTYENIEVVVVDDISTDDTEKIMKEYASRDNRVKYFRNIERLFIIKSLLRMLELAKGKFVVWPGADDWLSRDFIEKGVGNFSAHPEAAAVVPKIVSLNEVDRDKFEFSGEFGLIPGIHPREWLPKRIYKGVIATPTLFSLLRREDMISIISYFLKNYCNDQSLPDEFRKFAQRAYGIDHMYLSEYCPSMKISSRDDSIRS